MRAAVVVVCSPLARLLEQVVQALVAQVVRHKQQTATLHQLQTLAAVVVVLQVEHLQQQLVETVVQVL
jgi:uncharacterized protein with von Willebrand factor type A (vWA) domain